MKFSILTVHPGLLQSPFEHSIMKRAMDKRLVEIEIINLRDFTTDKHRSTDDYQYGGGAGMVMLIEPVARCLDFIKSKSSVDEVIYLSPDGVHFEQPIANELSLKNHLVLLCGHYKGIDERIRQNLVDRELSIGDYVLSGGELAASVVCDAVTRLIPGVLNDETSALSDSFQDGLIAPPVYTRPAEFRGWKVPEVLLSGNEALIARWRAEEAEKRTNQRRPGLKKN